MQQLRERCSRLSRHVHEAPGMQLAMVGNPARNAKDRLQLVRVGARRDEVAGSRRSSGLEEGEGRRKVVEHGGSGSSAAVRQQLASQELSSPQSSTPPCPPPTATQYG